MKSEFLYKLGKRIAKLREQKNWSQLDLALEADLMINTISKIENGKTQSRISTYQTIAHALDIDLGELVSENYVPLAYSPVIKNIVEQLNHEDEKTLKFIEEQIQSLLKFKKNK